MKFKGHKYRESTQVANSRDNEATGSLHELRRGVVPGDTKRSSLAGNGVEISGETRLPFYAVQFLGEGECLF